MPAGDVARIGAGVVRRRDAALRLAVVQHHVAQRLRRRLAVAGAAHLGVASLHGVQTLSASLPPRNPAKEWEIFVIHRLIREPSPHS